VPSGATSIRIANGEVSSHTGVSLRDRRGLIAIAIGAVAVFALVTAFALRGRGSSESSAAAVQPKPPPATETDTTSSEAKQHRQAGIDALQAKDYRRAISEFAEAMRLGANDPGLLQLMELARKLQREERAP
jgi:Flp pilus assembly protein TadD